MAHVLGPNGPTWLEVHLHVHLEVRASSSFFLLLSSPSKPSSDSCLSSFFSFFNKSLARRCCHSFSSCSFLAWLCQQATRHVLSLFLLEASVRSFDPVLLSPFIYQLCLLSLRGIDFRSFAIPIPGELGSGDTKTCPHDTLLKKSKTKVNRPQNHIYKKDHPLSFCKDEGHSCCPRLHGRRGQRRRLPPSPLPLQARQHHRPR